METEEKCGGVTNQLIFGLQEEKALLCDCI